MLIDLKEKLTATDWNNKSAMMNSRITWHVAVNVVKVKNSPTQE